MTFDPTPALRVLARREGRALAALDPAHAQVRVLRSLLRRAAATRFGRAHGFRSIRSVADYQRAVPLRDWASFDREWWAPAFPVLRDATWPGTIPFFAETSGTTGAAAKHIPVSREMVRANRRAALAVTLDHLRRHERSGFFGGPSLILGGSTALPHLPGGARSGDLSGIASATMPFYVAPRALPSRATALTADWDEKLRRVVAETRGVDLRAIAGTTSWLLILIERLLAASGHDRLDRAFPGLELVIHGGVGFAPYRERFHRLLGPAVARTEVYPASEGFFAFGSSADGDALRLVLDNGIFFEFVPVGELGDGSPTRHWIRTAETGVDYALAVGTNAGLFAYLVGDVVRLVRRDPPAIVITGRTAQTLSAFGEHLSAGELDRAVFRTTAALGLAAGEYTVAIVPPDEADGRGGHLFVVEAAPGADAASFSRLLDQALGDGNDDYRAHRSGDAGMRPPQTRFVRPGTFERWLRARGRVGGQVKVPRVLSDPASLASLLESEAGTPP